MNHNLEISVLLPFHRADEHLNLAVESCLMTTGCRVEIVLIDTRNSNEPRLVFENKTDHILRTVKAPSASYYSALKTGIDATNSPYLALMNSDDLVASKRFKNQLERLKSSKSDLCITEMRKFSKDISRALPSVLGTLRSIDYSPELLLLGAYGANATWLFSREWAITNDVFVDLGEKSDWKSALRSFPNTRIVWINEELYYYRLHSLQTTKRVISDHRELQLSLKEFNRKLGLPLLSESEHLIMAGMARPRVLRGEQQISQERMRLWRDALIARLCVTAEERREILSVVERRLVIYSLFSMKGLQFRNPKLLLDILIDTFRLGRHLRW